MSEGDILARIHFGRGTFCSPGHFCSTTIFGIPRTRDPTKGFNSPLRTALLPASPWTLGVSWGTLPQPHLSLKAGPWWQQARSRCCLRSPPAGSRCQPLRSGVPPRAHWPGPASQHCCSLGRHPQWVRLQGVSLEIIPGRKSERKARTCPEDSLYYSTPFSLREVFL